MKAEGSWFLLSGDHRFPKWQRSAWQSQDGTIYLPAVIAGGELEVMLCAGYDGTCGVSYRSHMYFPAGWLAREFPECSKTCERAIDRIEKEATFPL